MVYRTKLPSAASVANYQSDGRLFAPAAARNANSIVELVKRIAPKSGQALEIASGTGQHIVQLAKSLPNLTWSPSDVDANRLKSILVWMEDTALPNIKAPHHLDATEEGWADTLAPHDFILLVNLLHLISWNEAETLVKEVSNSLTSTGLALIYGPFMRKGELISEGDMNFHNSLVGTDPDLGYKNDMDMLKMFIQSGLILLETVEMPANNLAFVLQKCAV